MLNEIRHKQKAETVQFQSRETSKPGKAALLLPTAEGAGNQESPLNASGFACGVMERARTRSWESSYNLVGALTAPELYKLKAVTTVSFMLFVSCPSKVNDRDGARQNRDIFTAEM